MTVLVTCIADKPVVGTFSFARHSNIVARLSLQIYASAPIDSHILDKLEGVGILLIVFGKVGSHLQRTVHRYIECQLTNERTAHPRLVVRPCAELCLKNTWSIVHRSALQTCERQYGSMVGMTASEGFVFSAAGTLVAYHIRIGTTQPCRTYSLVGVDHYMIVGSFLDTIEVMVIHPLPVMMFTTGNYVADITTLDCIITVVNHKLICFVQMALVISG